MSVVEAVPNGRGLGVFHWEATWTAVDYEDRALPATEWFAHR